MNLYISQYADQNLNSDSINLLIFVPPYPLSPASPLFSLLFIDHLGLHTIPHIEFLRIYRWNRAFLFTFCFCWLFAREVSRWNVNKEKVWYCSRKVFHFGQNSAFPYVPTDEQGSMERTGRSVHFSWPQKWSAEGTRMDHLLHWSVSLNCTCVISNRPVDRLQSRSNAKCMGRCTHDRPGANQWVTATSRLFLVKNLNQKQHTTPHPHPPAHKGWGNTPRSTLHHAHCQAEEAPQSALESFAWDFATQRKNSPSDTVCLEDYLWLPHYSTLILWQIVMNPLSHHLAPVTQDPQLPLFPMQHPTPPLTHTKIQAMNGLANPISIYLQSIIDRCKSIL